MFSPSLNAGEIINNKAMSDLFQCGTQGGMRRSLKSKSLVLISDHVDPMYHDRWEEDIFYYTGMGLTGNQDINFMQNKTLAQSKNNGVAVFLFEKHRDKEYTFVGQVELSGEPFKENQLDSTEQRRVVWVFPLKLVNKNKPLLVSQEILRERRQREEKKALRMSPEELELRAENARSHAGTRNSTINTYERDPFVSEYAKRRAKGVCQLCKQKAPFVGKDNRPYLESHHVVWLSRGGEDSVENTVALCPNCHRKMHVLDLSDDVKRLEKILQP